MNDVIKLSYSAIWFDDINLRRTSMAINGLFSTKSGSYKRRYV